MKYGTVSLWMIVLLGLPQTALAAWGENWGEMVWGLPVSVPSVPGVGLVVLAIGLSATAAWVLRKRRAALGLPVLLVLLAIPLVVVAGTVSVPNTFVNGEIADADEVNDNFDAIETAVNDNDARITASQNTGNAVQSAAGANTTSISNLSIVVSNQSSEIAALQAQLAVLQTYAASFCGNSAIELGIETCDDGNSTDDGNGCSASCQANNVCGNGFVESLYETCDDGGTTGGDGCDAACAVESSWACAGEPSTCVLPRFTACADGVTVADNLTGLLWEQKTGTPGGIFSQCSTVSSCPDTHDVQNIYSWSSTGAAADGTAYTKFLTALNAPPGFAGRTDWRLPIISELQSIMVGPDVTLVLTDVDPPDPTMGTNPTGQAVSCPAEPCIDPDFAAVGGPTIEGLPLWSASSRASDPNEAFHLINITGKSPKTYFNGVRAVRTGSCTD